MQVAIIMGSASDKEIARKAAQTLREYQVPFVARVLSAHRTPEETRAAVREYEQGGVGVIIAMAGMAAHLAGAVAAQTVLPVIGVPLTSGGLGGMDALLSTVQMPGGIPVATVAVNGGRNAALLAIQILALQDPQLKDRLQQARENMRQDVLKADSELSI